MVFTEGSWDILLERFMSDFLLLRESMSWCDTANGVCFLSILGRFSIIAEEEYMCSLILCGSSSSIALSFTTMFRAFVFWKNLLSLVSL